MWGRRWFLGSALALIFVLSLGGVVWASAPAMSGGGAWGQTPMGRFLMGKFGRMLVLRSELGISDEQREHLVEIATSHRDEFVPVARDLASKKQALREAVLADKPDEAAIRQASDALSKSIGDAAVLASKVLGEARPVLTDAQRERVEQFFTEQDAALNKFLDATKT